ncbi:MAG: radical SAM protein [Clostridia bacterium]|nr:radical SAM protein [Clostridia bacterium]
MQLHNEKNYVSAFNEKTGRYVRIGKDENGRACYSDAFMGVFPELLDVGIMGHCRHGKSGLCLKAGVQCYQSGSEIHEPNMSLEDFRSIAQQCRGRTYQFALGGRGDPDQHEHFEEILKICRENGIVPNFTTSGFGMTEEIAKLCKKYCGAAAVSWYRSDYTLKAIDTLLGAGVKTNIHYVLSKSTVDEALLRLQNKSESLGSGFPEGINAVIFLLHKPRGLGTREEIITNDNEAFQALLKCIDKEKFPYKIGFDSCSVPALLSLAGTLPEFLDTCEAARWSAYISADMKMLPCSFCAEDEGHTVSLRENTIEQAWHSGEFEKIRDKMRSACPECPNPGRRNYCKGGCPLMPEIVICRDRVKANENKN